MFSCADNKSDIEKAQCQLADEVNNVIVELKPSGKVDAIKDMRFMVVAWRDPSRFKDPTTGKLSCFGKIITDNSVKCLDKADNALNCWMLMPENYNPPGIWVPADKIRVLMTGADGKNNSLSKKDGSFHSLQDALKNAGKLAGAALGEGVTMDLSLGDDDLVDEVFCFWQVAFIEIPEDDDAELETFQEVLSYGSGSGAEVVAVLMTGQGTSVKLLDGGYGSRTKVRPSLDVDGVRHEFNLSVTAMLDEHGKSVEVKKSGTESKESAMRAAAKGLAVEVPVGFGPKKISSSIVALCPIEKHYVAPPPPPPRCSFLQPTLPVDDDDLEEEDDTCRYRSCGASLSVDEEDPVDVGDAATAATLAMEDAMVVDIPRTDTPETLSEADMRPPGTNMFLTRQSRAKKSAGKATKILKNVKRGKEGKIMVSETIYVGIKPGTKPTLADIIAVNKLVQERMDAANALGGKETTLDSKYSEVQGATSSAPMSLSTMLDIATTHAAVAQAPIVGVPVGLF